MVTKKELKEGWTNIRISKMTLKRLRVIKAEEGYAHFDKLINEALNEYEGYKGVKR